MNWVATFHFFIPMAVSTPTSYLRSRTLKMLRTTRMMPPMMRMTMRNQPAMVLRVLRGAMLVS